MREVIENWLLGHWYCDRRPPFYLRLLEPVYRFGFEHSQKNQSDLFHPATPLIVVGNITAGGTGKTPLVIALCKMAGRMGLKAGIASTGYGRRSRETLIVQVDADPLACGDEPLLMAQRTGFPVVVASKRVDAVRLLDDMHLDLLISDDGLQQANLLNDIGICVVDGSRGLGNGHLIPAGPLRESSERLNQVDFVVTNGEWPDRPAGLETHSMQIQPREFCSLDGTKTVPVAQFIKEHARSAVHAVAGIGNPKRFFDLLNSLGLITENHGFGDHHDYRLGDFDAIGSGSLIIMTEKDAVKCRSLKLQNAYYLSIDADLPDELEQKLTDKIRAVIRERP